ncbi:MAG: hypothetical protein R3D52_11855 [Xanthobacteraceae bacterium]
MTQAKGAPPLLSELASEGPLTVHAVCHGIGVVGLAAAIILDNGMIARGAAAIGIDPLEQALVPPRRKPAIDRAPGRKIAR